MLLCSDIVHKTGAWSGMVGEVMTGKADLALADLTITAQREKVMMMIMMMMMMMLMLIMMMMKVVDFTVPFMQTGITILFSQPSLGFRPGPNISKSKKI